MTDNVQLADSHLRHQKDGRQQRAARGRPPPQRHSRAGPAPGHPGPDTWPECMAPRTTGYPPRCTCACESGGAMSSTMRQHQLCFMFVCFSRLHWTTYSVGSGGMQGRGWGYGRAHTPSRPRWGVQRWRIARSPGLPRSSRSTMQRRSCRRNL